MIISNYFRYFYPIFVIFSNFADAQNPPDNCICKEFETKLSLSDAKPDDKVVLIPETDPRHPRSLCKVAMNDEDAKWNDGYFIPTPKDVCTKKVRCYATGKPQMILDKSAIEGAECLSLEAVNNGQYRLGCLNGACVPFKDYPKIGRYG